MKFGLPEENIYAITSKKSLNQAQHMHLGQTD